MCLFVFFWVASACLLASVWLCFVFFGFPGRFCLGFALFGLWFFLGFGGFFAQLVTVLVERVDRVRLLCSHAHLKGCETKRRERANTEKNSEFPLGAVAGPDLQPGGFDPRARGTTLRQDISF